MCINTILMLLVCNSRRHGLTPLLFSIFIVRRKPVVKCTDKYNGLVKTIPHLMRKGYDGEKKTGNKGRGWNEERKKYMCVDRVNVEVASRGFRQW